MIDLSVSLVIPGRMPLSRGNRALICSPVPAPAPHDPTPPQIATRQSG
ncbi:MAG: hypothetical protein HQK59_01110 [Deltaproteobacteria bacterium]|nr:hypothetical protein [Deltaproteobacteria bacterium]